MTMDFHYVQNRHLPRYVLHSMLFMGYGRHVPNYIVSFFTKCVCTVSFTEKTFTFLLSYMFVTFVQGLVMVDGITI